MHGRPKGSGGRRWRTDQDVQVGDLVFISSSGHLGLVLSKNWPVWSKRYAFQVLVGTEVTLQVQAGYEVLGSSRQRQTP